MNWGTKLALGMGIFITFIMGMVGYMFYVHGRDDLIEKNYYEKGINYDAEYNAEQNVLADNAKPQITFTQNQIVIQVKDSATFKLILMKPSNSAEDVRLMGRTTGKSNVILVDKSKMAKGFWFLNLQWRAGNKDYSYKNSITL